MLTPFEIVSQINALSYKEKLWVMEKILKSMREEAEGIKDSSADDGVVPPFSLLDFSGIWDENEARIFHSAINESRKIDEDEW